MENKTRYLSYYNDEKTLPVVGIREISDENGKRTKLLAVDTWGQNVVRNYMELSVGITLRGNGGDGYYYHRFERQTDALPSATWRTKATNNSAEEIMVDMGVKLEEVADSVQVRFMGTQKASFGYNTAGLLNTVRYWNEGNLFYGEDIGFDNKGRLKSRVERTFPSQLLRHVTLYEYPTKVGIPRRRQRLTINYSPVDPGDDGTLIMSFARFDVFDQRKPVVCATADYDVRVTMAKARFGGISDLRDIIPPLPVEERVEYGTDKSVTLVREKYSNIMGNNRRLWEMLPEEIIVKPTLVDDKWLGENL